MNARQEVTPRKFRLTNDHLNSDDDLQKRIADEFYFAISIKYHRVYPNPYSSNHTHTK